MKHIIYLPMLLSVLLLTACSSQPIQFYMLSAETAAPSATVLPADTVLGLGPIHLPAYLDRPQLITALSEHQYQLDDQNRWAERLDDNIARVLRLSLAKQLSIEQVVRYPWAPRQAIDYQISFDILELHQTASGQSRFSVQWQLKKADEAVIGKRFECSEAAGKGAEASVAAQSRCLTRFSIELANEIAGLGSRPRR
ncbi:PqiC family protein [Methylomonas sp. MO1]|uniref:PqiC family protein n=1 Tax=Methylomonas sp. MO1 TaxID=3073619 RepID=UPI0028A461DF|nr:PqiC family protein [Methylomonas sp. MO1]MDT4291526.1 PqiC family protein [Methylomonas sp. MO1]